MLQKSLKVWVKCDYFEAIHIKMHVHTSNLTLPVKFLGIVGQDPSESKFNQLHVHMIFRLCFYSFQVYSMDLLNWSAILMKSQTSTNYFSNSTGSYVTNCRFSPSSG